METFYKFKNSFLPTNKRKSAETSDWTDNFKIKCSFTANPFKPTEPNVVCICPYKTDYNECDAYARKHAEDLTELLSSIRKEK
jgi:hypothetical protein